MLDVFIPESVEDLEKMIALYPSRFMGLVDWFWNLVLKSSLNVLCVGTGVSSK